jgi:hypothetical protein
MIALGKLAEAEFFLKQSLGALKEVLPDTAPLLHHSSLGIVLLKLNKPDQAKEHIRDGLRKGFEIRSALVQLHALSAAALYLADQGELERGIEIYALASRYPWIKKSRWFQDVIEHLLTTLTAPSPAEIIAAAQQQGRDRKFDETFQELLAELT